MPEELTQADRVLISELRAVGVETTAGQLKDYRAVGSIDPPMQVSAGQGPGRRSIAYPDQTAERVVAVKELLSEGVKLRHTPIALFWRGFVVDEKRLTTAMQRMLTDIEDWIRPHSDLREAAELFTQQVRARAKRYPVARQWIERSGEYGARRNSMVEDAIMGFATAWIAGIEPTDESKLAIAEVMGYPATVIDTVIERIRLVSLSNMRTFLADTTLEELSQARDLLEDALALFENVNSRVEAGSGSPLIAGLNDWSLGDDATRGMVAIVMAMIVRHLDGYEQAYANFRWLVEQAAQIPEKPIK